MWLYQNQPFTDVPDGYYGFIYQITNLVTNQSYIGKKAFRSYRSRKEPGKTRREHYTTESNWRDYHSSSDELKAQVAALGPEKFRRDILRLCKTKAELSYTEAEYQFRLNVLSATLPDGRRAFLNGNILNRFFARV